VGKLSLLAALMVMIAATTGEAWAQTALTEGRSDPTHVHVDFLVGSLTDTQWSKTFKKPGAGFVRLHFSNISDAAGQQFKLLVKDKTGRTQLEISDATRAKLWTPIISGDTAVVEVYAPVRPTNVSFDIDDFVYQRQEGVKYSIIEDQREEIYEMPPDIQIKANAVGKLQFVTDGIPKSCSGFLIGETSFLTNNHCVSNSEECDSAVVTFGYQFDADGTLKSGDKVGCAKVLATDELLDFTLLRLDHDPGQTWGFLVLADTDPSIGEQGYLIEHGGGMPKQISRIHCRVSTEPADGRGKDTDIGHVCDTLEGASGSPLLGKNLTVVGLHHYGFEAPGRWSQENRAVRMTLVRAKLVAAGLL
jgi:V8-like Glu-specific endopeptidase